MLRILSLGNSPAISNDIFYLLFLINSCFQEINLKMALKVLWALDVAKTQYYHFKAIIIAGMGLFTDSYDLFCIPLVMKMIGRIYYPKIHRDVDKRNGLRFQPALHPQ
ncbi:putative ABC-type phosphate transporter [Helianthus annuus]|nr:putative ABC-type phosphate transporter [Helianthus annuus]